MHITLYIFRRNSFTKTKTRLLLLKVYPKPWDFPSEPFIMSIFTSFT